MKIAILGFGREGMSLLQFLQKRGLARMATPRRISGQARIGADKHDEIWILDKNQNVATPRGVRTQLGSGYLKNLDNFDLIFRSPGVPRNLPELARARRAGVRFSSPTELFFEKIVSVVRRGSPQVVGITGTKGKGTTATLLYRMFKEASRKVFLAPRRSSGQVFLAGNIGKPALDILSKAADKRGSKRRPTRKGAPWVVLELSSFQLQDLRVSPHVAVVLDIFPDHQDIHRNLREYYEAKTNIVRYQRPGDTVFFFADDAGSKRIAAKSHGRKIGVSARDFRLFTAADIKIPGVHNFRNAVMAAAVAAKLGVPAAAIRRAATTFRGNEHRLELVRTIYAPRGQTRATRGRTRKKSLPREVARGIHSNVLKNIRISFYNDSASTNPQTAAAAIRAFPGAPKVLIAGGYDKGLDYAPLARTLRDLRREVVAVVLMGANRGKIHRAIATTGVPVSTAANLPAAVRTAYRSAKRLPPTTTHYLLPTVVLFSPGAASFDMFTNYAERGKRFKEAVKNL